ncbi:MAG: hypothetical protein AAF840_13045, partial [Bacteroidota bacterium]
MINILSFSTNPDILPVMDRLVNKQEGWQGAAVDNLTDAHQAVLNNDFDVVLLGAGTGAIERQALTLALKAAAKRTVLIDHYGGGSGLL